MTIKFKSIHIHHFLSFNDAYIDLTDRGYCLISGINKRPEDAAKSNGAGKSTISNAIAYALLGETISQIKDVVNDHFKDGCYVELTFSIDSNEYSLLRSKGDKDYGTNLKITINGEDKSGKGIRESQAVLDDLLPDVTRELVGSVILLGQGLPDKFTSNTPSGRKECLEHLTKSDFMIEDLKDKIANRLSELGTQSREVDDKLLSAGTLKLAYTDELSNEKQRLEDLLKETNLTSVLEEKKKTRDDLQKQYDANAEKLSLIAKEKEELNVKIIDESNLKTERLQHISTQYNEYNGELSSCKTKLEMQINQLDKEITDMKNIKDVCPTCGRPFEGVVKPDTSAKEAELEGTKISLEHVKNDIELNNNDYVQAKDRVNSMYQEATQQAYNRLSELRADEMKYSNVDVSQQLENAKHLVIKLESDIASHDEKVTTAQKKIDDYTTKLNALNIQVEENREAKENLTKHIEVVNKFNTYVKRDFRGILLSNSIDYINAKAKEYASKIFNTDDVEFKLDGNNIDILFSGRDYNNLSGGEKQRVDLITQFAIRDLLAKRFKFSSNIIFLDEITDNLDADSCARVMNFITQELKDIESTFIISHHTDLEIPVDSEIVIVKSREGISEVM